MAKINIIDEKFIYFGSYPQNGTINEPIKWRIIKKEDNVITLITDKILMSFMYDRYYSDYKECAARKYIHEEFIPKAFTKEELDLILPTELENGIVDKVFIPSLEDLSVLKREELILKVTPYAESKGASGYPAYTKKELPIKGNGWYWTRTPYKPPYNPTNDREVYYVTYSGWISSRVTVGHDIGIVPIIRLKIE